MVTVHHAKSESTCFIVITMFILSVPYVQSSLVWSQFPLNALKCAQPSKLNEKL